VFSWAHKARRRLLKHVHIDTISQYHRATCSLVVTDELIAFLAYTIYYAFIHCVSKNGHPFNFFDYSVRCWSIYKNIWQYYSEGNLQQKTFQILYLCVVFNCNAVRKHVQYSHCCHKHNAAKYDAKVSDYSIWNERAAKHSKRRSDQVFKMSSTSLHTSSSRV